MIREGTRQGLRLVSRRVQLDVDLFRCREQDRHYPMDRRDDAVRLGRKEAYSSCSAEFSRAILLPCQDVRMPAKKKSGFSSLRANQASGVLCPSTFAAGFGSAKLVAGTRHLLSGPSHRRQCGEAELRMLVTP